MGKFLISLVLLVVGGVAGWLIHERVGAEGFDFSFVSSDSGSHSGLPARNKETIRVASFNIQVFGESKMGKPEVVKTLAEVIRRFDIVAVQEIRAKNQDVLPDFVRTVNATGRKFDFVIGERLGRTSSKEQYAFVFDTERIEVDHRSVYTVSDPNDRLHREPLVALFRVRGPPPGQAFTFMLVNVHTDPDEVSEEMDAMDDVYRAVLAAGDGEDDVILLGDFNTDHKHMGQLGQVAHITYAIADTPTNTRGTKEYDNLIFSRAATTEFTGTSGVLDLMSEFQLTQEQAIKVSDHLPIWAEFSIYEGGAVGRVAGTSPDAPR